MTPLYYYFFTNNNNFHPTSKFPNSNDYHRDRGGHFSSVANRHNEPSLADVVCRSPLHHIYRRQFGNWCDDDDSKSFQNIKTNSIKLSSFHSFHNIIYFKIWNPVNFFLAFFNMCSGWERKISLKIENSGWFWVFFFDIYEFVLQLRSIKRLELENMAWY